MSQGSSSRPENAPMHLTLCTLWGHVHFGLAFVVLPGLVSLVILG